MIVIYGIKNCDTVKKALQHLDRNAINYEFVDFKKNPPGEEDVNRWRKFLGDWPVNVRGRTYRLLKEKFECGDDHGKAKMIIENTSLIKRPVLEKNGEPVCFGYDQSVFDSL